MVYNNHPKRTLVPISFRSGSKSASQHGLLRLAMVWKRVDPQDLAAVQRWIFGRSGLDNPRAEAKVGQLQMTPWWWHSCQISESGSVHATLACSRTTSEGSVRALFLDKAVDEHVLYASHSTDALPIVSSSEVESIAMHQKINTFAVWRHN